MGAQLLSTARLTTYSREAEHDADFAAIAYLVKAGYNPVGILTFMEKLVRESSYMLENLGIYATHPPSRERADAITAELTRRRLPIKRRATSNYLAVATKEDEINGEKDYQVLIEGCPVFTPARAQGESSRKRAKIIFLKLDKALDQNPSVRDVSLTGDHRGLMLRGEIVIDFLPEDAQLAGMSLEELARQTQQNIRRVIYRAWLREMLWQ